MNRYLCYLRVSTKGQGESGLGLEAQRGYLRHFLRPESIAGEVVEVQSGKDVIHRPVLRAAIDRCRTEGLILAIAKVDRLSRNTTDALAIYDELDGNLFSCDIPNNGGGRLDRFVFTIFMAIADRERELISIRTKQALAAKKERDGSVHPVKGHRSNFTDAGRRKAGRQRKVAARQHLSPAAVNYIRFMREKGETLNQIAERLNAEGHKTESGDRFHANTVRRILVRT
jgi:DNA invertase Pin-like site-specific DNA recombinase